MIVHSGHWQLASLAFDHRGSHMKSKDFNATATFTLTGLKSRTFPAQKADVCSHQGIGVWYWAPC
jgi:hypothetical protein